ERVHKPATASAVPALDEWYPRRELDRSAEGRAPARAQSCQCRMRGARPLDRGMHRPLPAIKQAPPFISTHHRIKTHRLFPRGRKFVGVAPHADSNACKRRRTRGGALNHLRPNDRYVEDVRLEL